MDSTNKIRSNSFELRNDARGFYYLVLGQGDDFTMDDLHSINSHIREMYGSLRQPFLIELAYGSTLSTEVQKFLAGGEDRYSSADAILVSTFAHKLISKFYLRHHKPKLPTKIFSDVFEALEWMKKYAEHPL